MLTARENFEETRKGGHPDRFVKQYEYIGMIMTPCMDGGGPAKPGDLNCVNYWGVTSSWVPGQPGAFPVHNEDTIVIKDFENWKDYVTAPDMSKIPAAAWEPVQAQVEQIDRSEQYVTVFHAPGIFEQSHYLGEIVNTLAAFYEYPDELKELYKYIADWEISVVDETCKYIKPEAIFHHDDWGSQSSTFIAPEMFDEFLLEPYKTVYNYWRENGVELIIHHSDSYAETLVPEMIEMGIDVWQGVMDTNNIPDMIEKYGDKITFMGGINSAKVDYEGWTVDVVRDEVRKACDWCGPYHFIPNASQGLSISTFPGVYEEIDKQIDEYSPIYWKEHGLA